MTPKATRLAPKRFLVDGAAIGVSIPAQEALGGTQVYPSSDGGLIVSGYVNARIVEALRRAGVVEQFSWGLTPAGLAIVEVLRLERAASREQER